MQRRSTRLPKQPLKNLAEEEFEPEDEAVEQDDDDIPLSKKLGNKKRKSNGENATCQARAKKVRGTRGILKQLVEMPLDVLFEIFGRLEPLDLLHLARTTKELRALLMSRSSMSIWKQSRSNMAGLPECPPDLSEPQYANLAFGKSCHFCHRNLGTMHTAWSARVRTCTKCLDDRFQLKPGYGWLRNQGYPAELEPFLPTIVVPKKSGRRTRYDDLYYVEIYEAWKEAYTNAADQAEWLNHKVEERKIIAAHSSACIAWFKSLQNLRDQQKASVIEARKALVVERLKQLGWEEELAKISEESRKPQRDPVVVRICQKELTERTLSSLDEFLNSFMESAKSCRLVTERKNLLRERLQILNSVLETHISTLPVNALHPSAGELFRNPVVLDIINNTPPTIDFTNGHFDAIVPMLPDITVQWQMEIEEKLLDVIRDAVPDYLFDRETVFQLATTSFDCSYCRRESMRHPAVLMHACAIKDYQHGREEFGDPDLQSLKNTLQQVYWNTCEYITFSPKSLKLMTEVVKTCGFDPKTTTAAEMDAANPILECVRCNNAYEGRATMLWWKAHSHKQSQCRDDKLELELLRGPEADIARARISESQERQRAERYYKGMICVHCKQTGNTTDLRKHVKKDHGKLNPTHEDVVPSFKSIEGPVLFRLWPPREEIDEPTAMVVEA